MTTQNPGLKQGAILMVIAALAFIGYAVVFLVRNFAFGQITHSGEPPGLHKDLTA